jgi:general secretion pathway protein C
MQTISLERSNLVQTTIVSLVTLAAVALLSLVLAHWTWQWFAPRPEPQAALPARAGLQVSAAYGLFGNAQRNPESAAPTGIAIRLLGIVAATDGRRGYALMQLEAKEMIAVSEGDNVAPGIRLAEVDTDHIILERGGVRETLAWPQKGLATPFAASPGGAKM